MESTPEGRLNEPAAGMTAGAWLKHARQQRGLHIAALAVMLKVPQAKLEAIESDRWDSLPDATFARALATAMCRALKVDAAPVLALLPRNNDREFDMRPGLNQPFRERAGAIDGGLLAVAARPVVWGPALLLLAAAGIFWLPAGWLPERDTAAASAPVSASAPAAEFVAAPSASAALADAPASAAAVVSSPEPVASAPLQVREVPAPANTVATAPTPAPAAVAEPLLRVAATADSWVEVVDARGQLLLSRQLRAGEQQDLSGQAPFKLRIGNVHGTTVQWRGAAVNLAERAKDNVARLELN
jgi:cytoskeleton protein RodZ